MANKRGGYSGIKAVSKPTGRQKQHKRKTFAESKRRRNGDLIVTPGTDANGNQVVELRSMRFNSGLEVTDSKESKHKTSANTAAIVAAGHKARVVAKVGYADLTE